MRGKYCGFWILSLDKKIGREMSVTLFLGEGHAGEGRERLYLVVKLQGQRPRRGDVVPAVNGCSFLVAGRTKYPQCPV